MDAILASQEPDESVARFLHGTSEKPESRYAFVRDSARMLRVELDGGVWLQPGAAIAYRGDITFKRLPTLEASSLKDAVLREASPLVKATGHGTLYCARRGMHVKIVRLKGDSLVVVAADLLAFEESLSFEMMLVAHGVGLAAGGLVAVKISGVGSVAISTHGDPLSLRVTPDAPVSTDPHATLAWSSALVPSVKTDLSWRSLFRHGGREPVQMRFSGDGFVVVQPYEDEQRFKVSINPLKRVKVMIAG